MKQHTTKLTSKGIQRSGLPSDYKKAISEYIWNGFDANASTVHINFYVDKLGNLKNLVIEDNGNGIDLGEISKTFGNFMDSVKSTSYSDNGYTKGKKGKGRYSFINFCNKITWETVFSNNNKLLQYNIEINKDSLEHFGIDDTIVSKENTTGTKVNFENFTTLYPELLEDDEFELFLSNEFGWFLYLNKDNNYEIYNNGIRLDYEEVIENSDQISYTIEDWDFKIDFIQWKYKFGDKYYSYFLNSNKKRIYSKPTSFNNKAIDFHHSIYIESPYFDTFLETKKQGQVIFGDHTQNDNVFKKLIFIITEFIRDKEKEFIKEHKADDLIKNYNSNNVFPEFKNNQYDRLRKEDLENVVKGIYTAQPRIFQNLSNTQSKTIVGFLNLLLDGDQRDNLLEILDDIVNLSDEERKDLANILSKSKIQHITSLVKFLESRYTIVETLKTLIYDLSNFTNERDHIQKVIEDNYWLFGEQYHLVSSDKNFEILLNNYLAFIEKRDKKPAIESLTQKDKLIRPDIFICKKTEIPDNSNSDLTIEENIIVELKRPNVIIGAEQFQQIEKYLRFIVDEHRFNSQTRIWKFILVGKNIDSYITDLYENQINKGKKYLVQSIRNFEIYAMTWDDIFRLFEIKHKHLIDKLEFGFEVKEELESKGINIGRKMSDELTRIALKKV